MSTKGLYDVINLKEIIEVVLRDYNIDEQKRIEIAQRVYEQYKNTVRTIATKYIETEAAKRSSLVGINNIILEDNKNAHL